MMSPSERERLLALEKARLWHPFTQMRDWCAPEHEPIVLAEGEGALLRDSYGREYIDGNSSIWTNIHGHRHPRLNAALQTQLERIAHSSFLGFTNEPAIRLADKLVGLFPPQTLTRVFFSDDGSTAMECALKMAMQCWELRGEPQRREWVAFRDAYHGDTLGAASLGGIPAFQGGFQKNGLSVRTVDSLDKLDALSQDERSRLAGVCIEPLIQGAAGMRVWPRGMLKELSDWCKNAGTFLVLDEVMTGFGRTGTMFACEQEGVVPDFLALAKGLTGGYMPLAATLTTEEVFREFLGSYEELKTFFYGHSYTANPLGCAVALASLEVFEEEGTLERLAPKIEFLRICLRNLRRDSPFVGDVRQCGFIAGIDILADPKSGRPFPWREQAGARACEKARRWGLLTRPVRDTLVLMLPLCADEDQIAKAVEALRRGIQEAAAELA